MVDLSKEGGFWKGLVVSVSSIRSVMLSRAWIRSMLLAGCLVRLTVACAGAEAGHLNLDGILKVKGMPDAGARLLLVQHDGAVVAMDQGLDQFNLTLELNSEYLLEFSREGCVSKQVLIDTRVPTGDYIFRDYGFPFQLTLQPPPNGLEFAYAGPVARVYFSTEIDDFSYDKDYRAKASPALVDAMAQAKRDPAPVITTAVVKTSSPVPKAPRHSENEAPLVHLTGPSAEAALVRERGAGPLDARMAGMKPAPLAAPVLRSSTPHAELSIRGPAHGAVPALAADVADPASTMDKGCSRMEELVVEKQRVTKIVRLVDQEQVTEYCRVEHHFGAVYHFRNGQPCTQLVYELGVGR
jgi:hypothetical protein